MSERLVSTGHVRREKTLLELGPLGPWRAYVKVTPLTGLGRAGTRFEVLCEWEGPGLEGLPPSPRPVSASDLFLVDELEHARRLAYTAASDLRSARVPRLRELAARVA